MTPASILLVEDNAADSDYIAYLLCSVDPAIFHLKVAPTLRAGLMLLDEHDYDAALVDLTLPDAAHLDAVEKIAAARPDLPVVVLTGLNDIEIAIASLNVGAQDYLSKDDISKTNLERSLRHAIERKRIAVDLSRSEVRYRALVSAMTSVVWSADPQGGFVEPQLGWASYTGQHWPLQRRRGWLECLAESERERVARHWDEATEHGREWETPTLVWSASHQSHRRCELRAVPVKPHGEVLEWIGTVRDVEDAKRNEEVLRRTERLAGLGTLAAGIAHEINNPIVAAWSSAEAAMSVVDSPDQKQFLKECLSNIVVAVERCRETVENVLHFARQGEVTFQPCDFQQALQKAVDETAHYAAQADVRFEFAAGEESLVTGNGLQLQQAVVALLRNAVDASSPNSIITITSSRAPHLVRARVVDRGRGMTKQELNRAFDPFFTSGKDTGTGLGLSIAYGIVERHGGTIELESELEQGTVATVTLPLIEAEDELAHE